MANHRVNRGSNRVVPGLENANTLGTGVHFADRWGLRYWQEGKGVVHLHIHRLLNGVPSHCSEIVPRWRRDWVPWYLWSAAYCWILHFCGDIFC